MPLIGTPTILALALDTSSPATSCALVELALLESGATHFSVRALAEELFLPPVKAGDQLPDALLALCARAGRPLDEVGALAVGLGPGSFTGLRVGLAGAKGLAYARRWPVAGASSLEALALSAARALHLERGLLVPSLEARRGELFVSACAVERGAVRTLGPERVLLAHDVPAWLAQLARAHGEPLLVGPGAAKNLELLRLAGVPAASLSHAAEAHWPSASALAGLCAPQLVISENGGAAIVPDREPNRAGPRPERISARPFDAQALFALAPLYLAESEAEKALAQGRVGKLPK